MKYITLLLLLVSFSSYSENIETIFNNMPNSFLPGFSKENKEMLLSSKNNTNVSFSAGDITKIKQENDYLQIKTSSIGTLDIKILPLINNTQIICVIKTICDKECDSNIGFFTTNWEPIDSKLLMPNIDINYFLKSNQNELFNFYPIHAEFKKNNDLALTLELTKEQEQKLKQSISNKNIILKWNKKSFIM